MDYHIITFPQIHFNMKKNLTAFVFCSAAAIGALSILSACKKSVDYNDYISEYRKSVYLCKEDGFELKIFCSDRETPYALDGMKGNMATVTEVYYSCNASPSSVVIEIDGQGGEMSYMSVTNSFYLSFSGDLGDKQSVTVKLDVDGRESETEVKNVFENGTIDAQSALKCVTEYDGETFGRLNKGNYFSGEIAVRLIYDDGCYYYIGVCDRDKNVKAYLVNGADGRIIAERESSAE